MRQEIHLAETIENTGKCRTETHTINMATMQKKKNSSLDYGPHCLTITRSRNKQAMNNWQVS